MMPNQSVEATATRLAVERFHSDAGRWIGRRCSGSGGRASPQRSVPLCA
jgi:hypothetical protein